MLLKSTMFFMSFILLVTGSGCKHKKPHSTSLSRDTITTSNQLETKDRARRTDLSVSNDSDNHNSYNIKRLTPLIGINHDTIRLMNLYRVMPDHLIDSILWLDVRVKRKEILLTKEIIEMVYNVADSVVNTGEISAEQFMEDIEYTFLGEKIQKERFNLETKSKDISLGEKIQKEKNNSQKKIEIKRR